DEHQLIGGFCFLKVKKFGLDFIKLPPYTPHCCFFFATESKNNASRTTFSKEVLTEVCNFISAQKAKLTILAFPSEVVDLQPFIWEKYKVVPNYTYRIDLALSLEQIVSNFDPKNRNVINKAVKENVSVSFNTIKKEELYAFFKNALNTAGANVYDAELEGVFKRFADENNSFSAEAWKEGKLIGIVFCIYDRNTCYYLLGGVDKTAGLGGINNLLVLKSIERSKELGCRIFDFEGSMLKGVEKFFRSFGGELFPYYTVNKASLPLEIALKLRKRELF
ncbi:MAG: GNAT family N-acetyltransferase, partial [Bacteroidia bacterium]|nr:GNAT family N-acetyltransferase [Bacteroidia bacterium]